MDTRTDSSRLATVSGTGSNCAAVDLFCDRLAKLDTVRLPAHLLRATSGSATSEIRLRYLRSLVTQNPSVFLERHGKLLQEGELQYFQTLSGDYEVNFYLKALRDEKSPPASTVKNRQASLLPPGPCTRTAYQVRST